MKVLVSVLFVVAGLVACSDKTTDIIGLPGPSGPSGEPGIAGTPGPEGVQGPAGLAGLDGSDGLAGADGVDGINGVDGAQGLPGLPGLSVLSVTIVSLSGSPSCKLVDGGYYAKRSSETVKLYLSLNDCNDNDDLVAVIDPTPQSGAYGSYWLTNSKLAFASGSSSANLHIVNF